MTTLADLYTAEAYEAAIARRNLLWVRWQDALAAWGAAGGPTGPLLGAVNDAQQAYEWAERDLVRARVMFRSAVLYGDGEAA